MLLFDSRWLAAFLAVFSGCGLDVAMAGARNDMLNAMQQVMTGDELFFDQHWLGQLENCLRQHNVDLPTATVSLEEKY